jgi:hypothetical protein
VDIRVRANLVVFVLNAAQELGVFLGCLSENEERGVGVIVSQQVEEVFGILGGAIVECQCDCVGFHAACYDLANRSLFALSSKVLVALFTMLFILFSKLATILTWTMMIPPITVVVARRNLPLIVTNPKFQAIRSPRPAGLADRNTASSTLPKPAAIRLVGPSGSDIATMFLLSLVIGGYSSVLCPHVVVSLLVAFFRMALAVSPRSLTAVIISLTSRDLPLVVANADMRIVSSARAANLAHGDSTSGAFEEAVAIVQVSPDFADLAPSVGSSGYGWNKQGERA